MVAERLRSPLALPQASMVVEHTAFGIAVVEYIYKSWFKLQQRLEQKLKRQIRWPGMLKSDEELTAESNTSLEVIRINAAELLSSLSSEEGSVSTKV